MEDEFSTNNTFKEEKKSRILHDQVDQEILSKNWKFPLTSVMPLSMGTG